MSIILLASLYLVPLVFIIFMVVLRNSFTLQQAGIITSIFTVIPGIFKMLEISGHFRKKGNQSIIDLINWFSRYKHENIAKRLTNNLYKLERNFNMSIIIIATSAFLSGQLMQLLATFIYP